MMGSSGPSNKIERAHQMYREGLYHEALGFYTDALSMAKTKPQKIALHSNRAACFLKLHDFKQAAAECTLVLELDHDHTGALMLRAQTLVTLKEYHLALFDVNRLMELNSSSEVYKNLYARLKSQLSLAPIPESETEFEEEENFHEEPYRIEQDEKDDENEDTVVADVVRDQKAGLNKASTYAKFIIPRTHKTSTYAEFIIPKAPTTIESSEQEQVQKVEAEKIATVAATAPQAQTIMESSKQQSGGWQAIPKPKGHSALDYARWDRVEDDSSDDDDDDDDEVSKPQFRFRVKTIGVHSVK
ncbi:TPR_11 domain-containing protein [Cephalotus follicularis]|uniref:TPR_11 domain-containing protein n=1 Tax=Cephalotus follicularis TaxID=3775 RepID=A0A1Q3B8F2_CEPFO|nr:TPR_11 domain-containing protein [Cephalotus follicularis]